MQRKLTDELEASVVLLTDTSAGCGSSFSAVIVSERFDGVGLLDRQRLVNGILADELKSLHAFSMKTWTPKQYAEKQAAGLA